MPPVRIPLRTQSEGNLREHWARRARRVRLQRTAARAYTAAAWPTLCRTLATSPRPVLILLTRVAPRALDSDNLAMSFKAIRDGVADALGVDDGSDFLIWQYGQYRGKPKEYAVEIAIQC